MVDLDESEADLRGVASPDILRDRELSVFVEILLRARPGVAGADNDGRAPTSEREEWW